MAYSSLTINPPNQSIPVTPFLVAGHNYLQVPKTMNQAPFTKDQLDMLQHLFNKSPQPTLAYGLVGVTQQGDDNQTLHVAKSSFASWIVDSGASDHMTGDKSLFS